LAKVFLIRHGEAHNPEGVLYGRSEGFPLSENGKQQVAVTANTLKESVNTATIIIASPMLRTLQTAEIISNKLGLKVKSDERLIESYSKLQGLKVAGGKNILKTPQAWKYLYNPFKPSWGEPYGEIAKRMNGIIEELISQGHEEIILVSHELPIFIAKRFYKNKSLIHNPRNRQTPLASISIIEI
jgi:broad specificity phosphatase PhoE